MNKVAFGLTSIEMGEINAATGLGENFADVGDIYRDTATLTTEDGETTDHYAELKQDPVITITEQGNQTLAFTLMDASADNLVKFLGGTVTTVAATPDKWNKPRGIVNIEASFKITTDDGTVLTINRGKVMAKLNAELSRKGVFRLDVTVRILNPLVDAVPAVTIDDNVASA